MAKYSNFNNYKSAVKAIILTRVSTKEQSEEGYSLEAQLSRLQAYCERKNLEVIKEFSIVESSTRGERKQFHEMLNFVKTQKECMAIVCDKVDRLQRSFREVPMLDELRRAGKVELHFNTENQILTRDSSSSQLMTYHLFILLAENYTNCISDNVKRSFDKLAKMGKFPHYALVGYQNARDEFDKATIIEDPKIGVIVRKLFKECATGVYTLADLVRKANEWGFHTKSCNKAHTQTIRNMLSNPFYYGFMRFHGELLPHQYPRLTDKETFDKCQEVLGRRLNTKKRKNEDVYKGIVRCSRCGGLMTPDFKGKHQQHHYLFCPRCKDSYVNEKVLDAEVEKVLRKVAKIEPKWYARTIKAIEKELKKDHEMERHQRTLLLTKLTQLENKEMKLIDLVLGSEETGNKSITMDLYNKKLTELLKEKEKINHELSQYSSLAHQSLISLKDLVLLMSKLPDIYKSSNMEEKRKILKLIFSNICMNGKNPLFSIRKPLEIILSGGLCNTWQGQKDSNSRHSVLETDALPTELYP